MTPIPPKPPLALVPGIQGRWEWMRPAVDALARTHTVRTFSLNAARRPAGGAHDGQTNFFGEWHAALDRLLAADEGPVPLVGVSFGGVVALTYAAANPCRVSHLVLVSAPAPGFELDEHQRRYLDWPLMTAPLFAARAVGRLGPEIMKGLPGWGARLRFASTYLARTARFPSSPRLMAGWVREWMSRQQDLTAACAKISIPTLVMTGDAALDLVVPVSNTREYLRLIDGSRHATLPDTGHVGLLLKPDRFAQIVSAFVSPPAGSPDGRRDMDNITCL